MRIGIIIINLYMSWQKACSKTRAAVSYTKW